MAASTVVRGPGEGTAYWLLGGLYEVLASSDETGGVSTIMRITTPSGTGPPPHTHPGGEAVLVVEGSLRYHIGGEVHQGGPGSFFSIPEGVVEHFEATGDSPLTVLVVYTPGGIDRFFAEVGEPAGSYELPPPAEGPPDFDAIVAAGAQHGTNILAPAG